MKQVVIEGVRVRACQNRNQNTRMRSLHSSALSDSSDCDSASAQPAFFLFVFTCVVLEDSVYPLHCAHMHTHTIQRGHVQKSNIII